MEEVAAAAGEADVIARSMWRAANWQQHRRCAVRAKKCVAAGPVLSLSLPSRSRPPHTQQTSFQMVGIKATPSFQLCVTSKNHRAPP